MPARRSSKLLATDPVGYPQDIGHHCNGDLGRGLAAQIEADGRMNPRQRLVIQSANPCQSLLALLLVRIEPMAPI